MARLRRISNTTLKRNTVKAIKIVLTMLLVYVSLLIRFLELLILKKSVSRLRNTPLDTIFDRQHDRMRYMRHVLELSDTRCIDSIRMNRRMFRKLCLLLVNEGGLRRSDDVAIDEMVMMFLVTIGHNKKNRTLQVDFCRSGQTISKGIHRVLRAILRLYPLLLRQPEAIPENCTDAKWKNFKGCLGALDGTHVKLRVRVEDKPRYRDREGNISMNVLGVCNPNLEFIYCLAGWEGSAHDGKVLRDALARSNGLRVSKGKYYLVDAGYSNCEGFLAPFRGQRYHLKEWGGGNRPLTPEEYYNMKHASARNVVERIFGVLKMRWAILREGSWFSPEVVTLVVNACCLLHNFIKLEQGVDTFERDYRDKEPEHHPSTTVEEIELISGVNPSQDWTQFRSMKAVDMWENRPNR